MGNRCTTRCPCPCLSLRLFITSGNSSYPKIFVFMTMTRVCSLLLLHLGICNRPDTCVLPCRLLTSACCHRDNNSSNVTTGTRVIHITSFPIMVRRLINNSSNIRSFIIVNNNYRIIPALRLPNCYNITSTMILLWRRVKWIIRITTRTTTSHREAFWVSTINLDVVDKESWYNHRLRLRFTFLDAQAMLSLHLFLSMMVLLRHPWRRILPFAQSPTNKLTQSAISTNVSHRRWDPSFCFWSFMPCSNSEVGSR